MLDVGSFVDLCFDVVSFVTPLTEKFQKFISALFKIAGVDRYALFCGSTFVPVLVLSQLDFKVK